MGQKSLRISILHHVSLQTQEVNHSAAIKDMSKTMGHIERLYAYIHFTVESYIQDLE